MILHLMSVLFVVIPTHFAISQLYVVVLYTGRMQLLVHRG